MPQLFFVVTIDAECDRSPNWRASNPLTFRSVTQGIPERLQPLFRKYAVKPTYLISSEVLEDDASVAVLRALSPEEAELGAHLHGAHIEPERRYHDLAGTAAPEFQCQYPAEIEAAKLQNLTALFRARLGFAPASFRAGRFGASARTLQLIAALGYRVDTSVTPHLIWDGQIDFRRAPEQPYLPDADDINRLGDGKVLEVPVTIGVMRHRVILRRARWLRPSFESAEQMIALCEMMIRNYATRPAIVLNMMFHSMEVLPNVSPYTRSDAECAALLNRIERVLQFIAARGARFVGLGELTEWLR